MSHPTSDQDRDGAMGSVSASAAKGGGSANSNAPQAPHIPVLLNEVVAALAPKDGEVFVVKAGAAYELLAVNRMGEPLMATPAASDGMLLIRGQRHLFAVK